MASKRSKKQKIDDRQARRHDTPPTEPVTPPSRHAHRLLPLVDVGSVQFEHLCTDLLRAAYPDIERVALKRVSGVAQYGVDVEGFDDMHRPVVVVSCKLRIPMKPDRNSDL